MEHKKECGCGCGCNHDAHEETQQKKHKNIYIIENLGCANCAAKMERKIQDLPEVETATLTFVTKKLVVETASEADLLPNLQEICASVESQVVVKPQEKKKACSCGHEHHHHHEKKETCGCGCGHDHHHEHEEHEECSCGCHDHHHEHEEHEECSCGCHDHDETHRQTYIIENLGCANCAAKMERKINDLPEVEHATITFATRKLVVNARNQEGLLDTLQKICASVEAQVIVIPQDSKKPKQEEKKSSYEENRREIIQVVSGAVLFAAGVVAEHFVNIPYVSACLFVVAYLILGISIIKAAIKNLTGGNLFDENFLMAVATIAAFAIGDFAEAVGVMLFYRVGELFEDIAVERSRSQIMEAVDMRPEVVNLVKGTKIVEVPAEIAKTGDKITIRPGDRIPLDAKVIKGESRIDTSPVTGEPVPVHVKPGDELVSGCVNEQSVLMAEVLRPLSESMVTRILDSAENAAASKPKIDRFITRFARVYTPVIVVAAILTAIIPSLITGNWNHWIYTAITFLVISCPCALVLSVPLAFFSGIGAGSKRGILFKGGVAIEALKDVKAVVMDKTGTITKGNFAVQQVKSLHKLTEKQVLTMAADCEQDSTHPIAVSIVKAAKDQDLKLVRPREVEEISGKGIKAIFPEGIVLLGNRALMEMHQVDLSEYHKTGYGSEILLAVDGVLEGTVLIADEVKADAVSSIRRMKAQGISTVMLTGDETQSAQSVAQETGIDEVYAQLLPQEKLAHLQDIRTKHGTVMFVGDGINDAPVLAGADVGAAMGSGADAAIEAADVVFMTSSVEAIPQSIAIAKTTGRIAVQNVVFALLIKAIVMILGFLGFANMWLAVFADTGVAMLCVLNSIRALYANPGK